MSNYLVPPSLESPQPPSASEVGSIVPIKRPDRGGQDGIRSLQLLLATPSKSIRKLSKSEAALVKEHLFSQFKELFPISKVAYDGERNIYSVEKLQCGKYKVDVHKGEDGPPREFLVSVKEVASHNLHTLVEYLNGSVATVPRDILQALDVVMRQNPCLRRIPIGRCFFSKREYKDLGGGIIASTGFHQSLKTTARGLVICVDYRAIAFRKHVPVLQFLEEHLGIVCNANTQLNDRQKMMVLNVLRDLKVTVNHRQTKQKYVIAALSRDNAENQKFEVDSGTDSDSKRVVSVANYFLEKYHKDVVCKWLPCLDLSKNKRPNYVPMEFCELVEGQPFPRESLLRDASKLLKDMAMVRPSIRKDRIYQMIRADDGPSGGSIADEFHMAISNNMTEVTSRVLKQPDLKIRNSNDQCFRLTPKDDGQWNLLNHKVVDGKQVDRWAILDFTASSRRNRLYVDQFVRNICESSNRVGVRIKSEPLFYEPSTMNALYNEKQLHAVLKQAYEKGGGKLQVLFCPMEDRHPGYNTLKRICETELGLVTQCLLSYPANEGKDQYFVNLALKVNAKLGGSNMELFHKLPCLNYDHHVMFMGADVNHPGSKSRSNISIAAVTASMNWPGANQYAFRLRAQPRRTEQILEIGSMCSDLIQTYARKNGVKPGKIVLFRDGVSDTQFEMVLNKELEDIRKAVRTEEYQPTITLVVAQKRHQTRFFPKNQQEVGKSGNIPPGTVVDQGITAVEQFDFFLSSHNGSLGTSKPTHYHVLIDENNLSSDDLQRIIYNLCYTFPRCTKPVSLVPPVLCADLAAYRGRLYEESFMCSPSSTSSSSGSSASSSSMASAEMLSFPKVHADLENLMIFC
ncbi:Protein argonaute-2 [Asimina triloba]